MIQPVHEATPWINSFMLVETKDKSTGKPKLCVCLDPTNLNKAIIYETYCFGIPEDIAPKLTGATIITVSDFSKGYRHQCLLKKIEHNIFQFGSSSDHSQQDQCDHDIAFTKFLETTKKNNIKLNYDKIQYKQKAVEFFSETCTTKGCKPSNAKSKP